MMMRYYSRNILVLGFCCDSLGSAASFSTAKRTISQGQGRIPSPSPGDTGNAKDHWGCLGSFDKQHWTLAFQEREAGAPYRSSPHRLNASRKITNPAATRGGGGGDGNDGSDGNRDIPHALRTLATWIGTGRCRRILALTGAGVSVSAGIPDFRSPGTGLYDQLKQYDLPFPEAVFDLGYFRRNPRPFCALAKQLWPERSPVPTLTHAFLAMLAERGLLLRNYSQNIDGLEFAAGVPEELLVECHGHARTSSCVGCGRQADPKRVRETIFLHGQPLECEHCRRSYVKPDIVFFGELMPDRFSVLLDQDLVEADLVLVLGTSLEVAPVAMIPDLVAGDCKRCLINLEAVGQFKREQQRADDNEDQRDLFCPGQCDDSVRMLARLLGWESELEEKHSKLKNAILAGYSPRMAKDSNNNED